VLQYEQPQIKESVIRPMKNMNFKRKLPVPQEIKAQYPLTAQLASIKQARDIEIADVFTGKSNKLVLIIGPCSADREDAVLEYCDRLANLQEKVTDKLILIPRVYTNKPRTTGDGYKGLLHQPDPEKQSDMLEGVIAIRRLHTNVLANTGLSTADEMLYPDNYRYLSDLLAYVAVGARSVENQEHRLTASGIAVPVGMKNPTSGDISVMLNSIMAAQHPHTFIYRGWEVDTTGNPLTHAILRGYVNRHGEAIPNYHFEELEHLYNAYNAKGLENISLIVDTNHSNSAKKYMEQPRICKEVLHSCRHSEHIRSMVKGFMIESYLAAGSQKIGEHIYGKSITDPCIGWAETEKLVLEIADLI
jgi:3-deoxy-7-phosphoheptulonate synthase